MATRLQGNGIDLEAATDLIEGLRAQPEAGAVRIRTRHRWDDGFAVDGATEWVEQAGETTAGVHRFRGDWPEPFGRDSGPTSAETILSAVGACVAATYAFKAALSGVAIDEIEVVVTGGLDLGGFAGTAQVRPGLSAVEVELVVHAAADDKTLERLAAEVSGSSPALDVLRAPVDVGLSVRRRA